MHTACSPRLPIPGLFLLSFLIGSFLQAQDRQVQDSWSNARIVKTSFSKSVTCLVKDRAGFLWLGTSQGLYRYDGYAFSLINTLEGNGLQLSDPQVNAVLEDIHQNLWVATENGVTVINPGRDRFVHLAAGADNDGVFQNDVGTMVASGGFVWFGTRRGHLYQVPSREAALFFQTGRAIRPRKLSILEEPTIKTLQAADQGGVWTSYKNKLTKVNTQHQIVHSVRLPEALNTFCFANDGKTACAAGPRGIFFLDSLEAPQARARQLHAFGLPGYIQEGRRRKSIQPDGSCKLWVFGAGGIFGRLDPGNISVFTPTAVFTDLAARFARFDNEPFTNFNALCLDQPGHGWVGRSDGLYEIFATEKLFHSLPFPALPDKPGPVSVRGIHALPDSTLLVGTYSGLFRYRPRLAAFERIGLPGKGDTVRNPLAYDFDRHGDTVYIASESNGLLFYRISTGKITALLPRAAYDSLGPERSLGQWSVSVHRDHAGTVWIGTYGGLMYWRPQDTLATFRVAGRKPLNKTYVHDVQEDRNHRLWLATSSGLYSIPPSRDRLENHPVAGNRKLVVYSLLLNPDGTVWVSTKGEGLKHYNPATGVVKTYTTRQGLPDNVVVSIQPAGRGNLWLGTHYGLCYFNPRTNAFLNYFKESGLPDNEFNHNAMGSDRSGTVYLGLVNGLVTVNDQVTIPHLETPQPLITQITRHDDNDNRTYHQLFSSFAQNHILLAPKTPYFSVQFSIREFTSEKPQFSYQLEGISPKWNYLGEQNSLQFTSLPPGTYTLRVRARVGKSDWSARPLQVLITVERPLYQTWWAYLGYLLVMAGLLYTGLRLYLNRLRLKQQWQAERAYTNQLQELDQARTRFFTNIAHELRTPLTLIRGPIGKIGESTRETRIQKLAAQANQQAESMLNLVNQMLDLHRIEAGQEKLRVIHADIVRSLALITQAYDAYADEQRIDFRFEADPKAFVMDFDPDKLEKILQNLLSNAFKFTPTGGQIVLRFQQEASGHVILTLTDTGIGITPDALPRIFERFFQVDSSDTRPYGGTGIGLSYVKELVTLHNGTIAVESQPGQGTQFRISLPVRQPSALPAPETAVRSYDPPAIPVPSGEIIPDSEANPAGDSALPVVLLVEDHPELASFVADCLADHYQVHCAFDGAEGYRLAVQWVPDLIITDLMLPKTDGLTLARQLKAHELTSHIPLVMLTARASDTERIHGLAGGADAYLVKPFRVEELLLTTGNLLELRDRIARRHAGGMPAQPPSTSTGTNGASVGNGQPFLDRIARIVEQNLANENFGVNELLRELGTSRTQLHRKLKAINGQPALELLRSIRMQKALDLLRTTDLPVAEVGMRVGFGSASHFAKVFGEYFGFTPSTVREKADTP